ncbi:MAG: ABC transporter permease [Bacteroidales bacterium]|nr:ABC transporter permease [Bacteroidales bacterium]
MYKKLKLIIKREYLIRVKKKSFIVITLIGPFLFSLIFFIPIIVNTLDENELKIIAVVDSSKIFYKLLPDNEKYKFIYLNKSLKEAEKEMINKGYYAVIFIPSTVLTTPVITISSTRQPSYNTRLYLISAFKSRIEALKLVKNNVDPEIVNSIKTDVKLNIIKLNKDGKRQTKTSELQIVVGVIAAVLIYFFIFMYSSMVMKGVMEEKVNRIVEIIASSVKPFQWMMGKIIGVALVGLTQFISWATLTVLIIIFGGSLIVENLNSSKLNYNELNNTINSSYSKVDYKPELNDNLTKITDLFVSIDLINFPLMIGSFLFYFIFGYFMYASIFAAIAGVVDNEADTQQFMLPVTIPLILTMVLFSNLITNPEGPIAFWLSMIPLTSPVAMMVRIAFGVPVWQYITSVLLLILSFVVSVWISGKIYRAGLLLYGKKVTYKDLLKWIRL